MKEDSKERGSAVLWTLSRLGHLSGVHQILEVNRPSVKLSVSGSRNSAVDSCLACGWLRFYPGTKSDSQSPESKPWVLWPQNNTKQKAIYFITPFKIEENRGPVKNLVKAVGFIGGLHLRCLGAYYWICIQGSLLAVHRDNIGFGGWNLVESMQDKHPTYCSITLAWEAQVLLTLLYCFIWPVFGCNLKSCISANYIT